MPGSISEKLFVDINGVQQGMFITSTDSSNPVLLFVHGGIGMPEYFLNERHPSGLEKHFTVCWWERRGAGLSYTPGMSASDITIEQWVSDTLAVTDYLSRSFSQDRIYLMAHSGGSFIGIQAAARSPEKYRAYVGTARSPTRRSPSDSRTAPCWRVRPQRHAGPAQKLQKHPVLDRRHGSSARVLLLDGPRRSMHELGCRDHAVDALGRERGAPAVASSGDTPRGRGSNIWRGKRFLQKSTGVAKRCSPPTCRHRSEARPFRSIS